MSRLKTRYIVILFTVDIIASYIMCEIFEILHTLNLPPSPAVHRIVKQYSSPLPPQLVEDLPPGGRNLKNLLLS